jgi:hypothetical protein
MPIQKLKEFLDGCDIMASSCLRHRKEEPWAVQVRPTGCGVDLFRQSHFSVLYPDDMGVSLSKGDEIALTGFKS